MAITTRPYDGNAVAGDDGPYSAQQWRDVWHSLFGGDDGTVTNSAKRGILFGVEGNLRVTPSSPAAKSVEVLAGAALIQGMWFESTAQETVSISANASGSTRYDIVVAQYDDSVAQNVGDITVVEGTPGAGIPALTQSLAGIYQIPLAILTLVNGYSTVTAAEIEDARALSNAPQATAIPLINKSGADLYAGDVTIQDTGNAQAVTTTTTANSRVMGVVVGWGANNAYVQVVQNGLAWVKVAGAVSIGDRLIHSTTAKKAKAGVDFTAFGVALQSGTDTIILAAINVPPLNNILTTRGDILIRGANGLSRLAVGGAGEALLSDGTDPYWGSGGVYSGAVVYHSSDQTFATTGYNAAAFNSEVHDTDSYHDTVTNNSRLTAPANGTYRISANIQLDGNCFALIYKDGAALIGNASNATSVTGLSFLQIVDYGASSGAYYELYLKGSSATRTLYGGSGPYESVFMIERLA